MDDKKGFDFLNILTKQQIIEFLKKELWYNGPTEREVYNFAYFSNMDKLLEEQAKYIEDDTRLKLAKEADRYGELFNNEIDNKKKMEYLEKRAIALKSLKRKHAKFEDIQRKIEKNETKYGKFINA